MRTWFKRLAKYMAGIGSVSLGIVLCAGCGWGISPISSWPFVMQDLVPMTFGTLTFLFHLVHIAVQYLLEKKRWNPRVLLQVPLALLFGLLIDGLKAVLPLDSAVWYKQLAELMGSVLFTALGMVLMLDADLVQNPPDGTVRQIALKTGRKVGGIKVAYDIVMVVSSSVVSLAAFRDLRAVGGATIVSAVFVGKCIGWLKEGLRIAAARMAVKKV